MFEYTLQRVLLLVPTVIVGSVVLFAALTYLPPQDAVELRIPAEQQLADPTLVETQRRALGIYGPPHERYLRWAKGFVTGDWGKSLSTQRSIAHDLMYRIPVSFELSFIGLFVTWALSFPLGVFAAVKQDTRLDYVLRTSAYALDALPSFVLGIVLLTVLAVYFDWAPPPSFTQIWEDPANHFKILLLPALIHRYHVSREPFATHAHLPAGKSCDRTTCVLLGAKASPSRPFCCATPCVMWRCLSSR